MPASGCGARHGDANEKVKNMKRTAVLAKYEPICESIVDHMPNRFYDPGAIMISCYENDVPAFIEAEMARLYASLYSSLVQFRIYGDGRDTSTYIVRKGGKIVTVLLFQQDGGKVRVVNEVIKIDEEDISRFAAYIFANVESATVIFFKSIQTDLQKIPFPHQRFNHLEDIVLTMPQTAEDYVASLGKNTRRNIKRYTKKLREAFPSFYYDVSEKDEVDEQTIRDIVNLNRARMADKNKVSAIDEEETERIILLTKECGLVGVARIDGRVCAGGISFRVGSNYFLSVIAHDPAYDDYWLGILCCYLTICECIARGGKEFHFLWGEYEYKYTLLGVKRDLDKLAIYRSHAQMLLNGDMALSLVFHGYARQARLWLHAAKHRDSFLSRLTIASLNRWQLLKQRSHGIPVKHK